VLLRHIEHIVERHILQITPVGGQLGGECGNIIGIEIQDLSGLVTPDYRATRCVGICRDVEFDSFKAPES
jgi:hypothetical protein